MGGRDKPFERKFGKQNIAEVMKIILIRKFI
jgi:hypothetical protein